MSSADNAKTPLRALIAGGAGFIGSHLVDRFLQAGYEVVALDNFLSGSRANLAHLADNPHFRLIEADLTQPLPADLPHFTHILHFASPASPNPQSPVSYMAHPLATLRVNSYGTEQLLELATATHAQIILASTSEIYGNPTVHPQPEDYLGNVSSLGPRSCYDEAKRYLEAVAMAYHRTHSTRVKLVRIFNTYGPRMRLDDGRFVPNLISSYLRHEPFVMFGNGQTTRSFGYVQDLVAGIMAVADMEAMVGEVVNLGNPEELTLNEAITIFEQVAGVTLPKQAAASPVDDPARRCPDITKAKKLLNWSPQFRFAEGLAATLKFYKTA